MEHSYFGAALSDPASVPSPNHRIGRHGTTMFQSNPHYSLNDTRLEYPTFGTSDFRHPAFAGKNADGNSIFSFQYLSYKILTEKPALSGLPSARGQDSETLIITLQESYSNLQVDLIYTIWRGHTVISRSSKIRNSGDKIVSLNRVFSTALSLPAEPYEIQHFYGTWAREFNEERFCAPKGRFVIESLRGTSSAAHHPYVAILETGTTEEYGRCYGSTLVYSGNFSIEIETGEFEDLRLLVGIHPFGFDWTLNPGQEFSTPESLHAFSNKGLRGLSHHWHDFIRANITPQRFRKVPRPTYLNTWEAAYFNVDEDKVLELADKANDIGVEMLVLDDGWFQGRKDASSSLGDWRADERRFPSGIPALAKKVKAKGLKFGIWVEPEMVNPDSDLFRVHPDWVLGMPGHISSLGRNQLVLDLSRVEVQTYIYDVIDEILSCENVDYVKWDMNRNMTEVGSEWLPQAQQGEVAHRYMLGLYNILSRLVSAYPNVLFETCASGGNRFDLGMLSFMPQGWISDMCDPIGRLSIINGASHLYPLDVMAAYIGPSPNHQNGRKTSILTRFMAGVFCSARGVSLSETDIEAHKDEISAHMRFAKLTSKDMLAGQFYRLEDTGNSVVWQYMTSDKKTVYLAYFHSLSAPNLPMRRARLVGLEPNKNYDLQGSDEIYRGDTLMEAGIPLPQVSTGAKVEDVRYMPDGDFSSHLFVFRKTAG